jgi:hypothetical protein
MDKKLITEMRFMMERLESPRMTDTELTSKRKNLIKESITIQDIKDEFGGEMHGDQLIVNRIVIEIEDDKIEYTELPKMDDMSHIAKHGSIPMGSHSNDEIFKILSNMLS